MYFASDNAGPVHPNVMAALEAANQHYAMPYGADRINEEVVKRIRAMFDAPEAAVYLVATGTAANSLALATLSNPWETVFCSPMAHIHEDECNAPEFYMGGGKLTLVPAVNAKMTPDALRASIAKEESRGVHGPQRGPVSITQVTERGTVYSIAEINALTAVAKEYDLPVHLDGARFTNAMVSLGCSPADMTWRAGVDAVSFGGTKNGLMGVEAVIFFDPKHAWEFELRRKRGAHLFSKHRYLSAQMMAYLANDLWVELAGSANTNARRLAMGLRQSEHVRFEYETEANIVFASFPRSAHKRLQEAGALYYVWNDDLEGDDPDEMLMARMVCDWSISDARIDRFVSLVKG